MQVDACTTTNKKLTAMITHWKVDIKINNKKIGEKRSDSNVLKYANPRPISRIQIMRPYAYHFPIETATRLTVAVESIYSSSRTIVVIPWILMETVYICIETMLDRGYIKSLSPYQSNLMSFREDATSSIEPDLSFSFSLLLALPFSSLFLRDLPTSGATFAATLSRCIRVLPS